MATVGATPSEADYPVATASGFPTEGCKNEYGSTKVTFSMPGQGWTASMNYCSWGQINVLTPSTLPVGQTVMVTVFRNGAASNSFPATVVAAAPSVFMADATSQLGAVTFVAASPLPRLSRRSTPRSTSELAGAAKPFIFSGTF